jgi:acyl-coenzyme A synthetase/AMP-(fatty) acid ligase
MNTPLSAMASLRSSLGNTPAGRERWLWGASASVRVGDLLNGSTLGGRAGALAGLSVLVATRDQFAAALALVELDGVARRLIVSTPDVSAEHLRAIVANAGVEAIVSDHDGLDDVLPVRVRLRTGAVVPNDEPLAEHGTTEWVLLTSGTTGAPKMLVHTVATLTAPIRGRLGQGDDVVWGTFYDIRRYGGLQIFFRAVLGRGSFVLSGADESTGEYLLRLGTHGVTHVSGTPSHWRRVLMNPHARAIAPRYIRLSGEIADQAILNALHAFYPDARIGHAFASTEAGVAFEVDDGLEGFPASLIDASGHVRIKIEDGSLRIASGRNAVRYAGAADARLTDDDGFVDTGDVVARRGDRYYFLGRRNGVINVGGLKVYPEEVEAAINRHPAVRMSMVRPRKSPITGSLVAADVVLNGEPDPSVSREILRLCRDSLAPHKIPVTIRFVPALEIAAAGKLARHA